MEIRDYITIGGICIASATALSIAHLHRKQMRQVEAYRVNPEVGLVPPPNPVRVFIKANVFLLFAAIAVGFLLLDLFSSGPVTRRVVFNIVFDIASCMCFLFIHSAIKFLRHFGNVLSLLSHLSEAHLTVGEFVVKQQEINETMVEALKLKADKPPTE